MRPSSVVKSLSRALGRDKVSVFIQNKCYHLNLNMLYTHTLYYVLNNGALGRDRVRVPM